jgi:hypothetical protein
MEAKARKFLSYFSARACLQGEREEIFAFNFLEQEMNHFSYEIFVMLFLAILI